MTLYEFAMQTSQDEDLAKIAKAIPSEVTEISIDERFEGMELKIALTGPISSKRALKAMEQYLRQVLHLSHLRIYITNMQSEYGKLSIPSVLEWILWVINTKTGYGACIDELVFDENAVRILLQTQLSDEVKDSISDFINQFFIDHAVILNVTIIIKRDCDLHVVYIFNSTHISRLKQQIYE